MRIRVHHHHQQWLKSRSGRRWQRFHFYWPLGRKRGVGVCIWAHEFSIGFGAQDFREPLNACRTCGTDAGEGNPTPEHCRSCPPTRCDDCGHMSNWATGDLCPCWTSLEDMSLADLKALFADECEGEGMSIEVKRSIDWRTDDIT